MLALSKRGELILRYIINSNDAVSGNELADLFNVTDRSIRNDIRDINRELAAINCCIESSTSKGYRLSEQNKESILQLLSEQDERDIMPQTPSERFIYLSLKLLLNQETESYDSIAEEIFYSKTTVASDIAKIERFFKKHNIQLDNTRRITATGRESDIRIVISSLFSKYYDSSYSYMNLLLQTFLDYDERLFYQVYDILVQTLDASRIVMTDKDLIQFTHEIIVSVLRSKDGYPIESEYLPRNDSLIDLPYQKLELVFSANILPNDRFFIDNCYSFKRLLSSNTSSVNSKQAETIISKYFKELNKGYNLDLNSNEELKRNLSLHINSLVKRIQYEPEENSYLIKDIKLKYAYSFELATVIIPIIQHELHINLTENELAYIAIHLAVILETNKKKNNVVIICGSGLGTAQLVIARLNNAFASRIDIKAFGPVYRIKAILKEHPDIDIIISTIPITEKLGKPVVMISPLVSDEDIRLINSYLSNSISSVLAAPSLPINPDLFFILENCDDKNAILQAMVHKLYQLGYIRSFSSFYASVLQREKLYSTVYEKIWLPHPMKSMSSTTVSCVGIVKNDENVKLVFLPAINAHEREKYQILYSKISHLVSDRQLLDKACACSSFLEFKSIYQSL